MTTREHTSNQNGEISRTYGLLSLNVELGPDGKRIKSTMWQNEQRINIRKWAPHPTKEGVSLPLKRYLLSQDNICVVSQALLETKNGKKDVFLKRHLGGNVYIHVKSPFVGVDLRQWFIPNNEETLKPGKGIFLKSHEWKDLCDECK